MFVATDCRSSTPVLSSMESISGAEGKTHLNVNCGLNVQKEMVNEEHLLPLCSGLS